MWHLDVGRDESRAAPAGRSHRPRPGGHAHYPGTGLPDQYRDHFFSTPISRRRARIPIQPHGARYPVDNPKDVLQDNSQKNMTGSCSGACIRADVDSAATAAPTCRLVIGWENRQGPHLPRA